MLLLLHRISRQWFKTPQHGLQPVKAQAKIYVTGSRYLTVSACRALKYASESR